MEKLILLLMLAWQCLANPIKIPANEEGELTKYRLDDTIKPIQLILTRLATKTEVGEFEKFITENKDDLKDVAIVAAAAIGTAKANLERVDKNKRSISSWIQTHNEGIPALPETTQTSIPKTTLSPWPETTTLPPNTTTSPPPETTTSSTSTEATTTSIPPKHNNIVSIFSIMLNIKNLTINK